MKFLDVRHLNFIQTINSVTYKFIIQNQAMLSAIKQEDRSWLDYNLLGMVRKVLSELELVTFYPKTKGRNHVDILGKELKPKER